MITIVVSRTFLQITSARTNIRNLLSWHQLFNQTIICLYIIIFFFQFKPRKHIRFYPFAETKNLCVCHDIDLYLEKMNEWQKKLKLKLVLSLVSSHKAVLTGTMTRCLKEVLRMRGIDTKTFMGCSTRATSSFKAKILG